MASTKFPGVTGTVLSNASRFSSLQRALNDRLREWHWQRNSGSYYQLWTPPGIVFARLKQDHHAHGKHRPPLADWCFEPSKSPLHLVLGAMNGRWVNYMLKERPDEKFVVADGDTGRLFHMFSRAMDTFALDPQDPEEFFPNFRLIYCNERHVPKFLEHRMLRSVRVHLPWAARETRPRLDALVNEAFVKDVCEVLEVRGEIHIVSDNEQIMQQACGELTKSRLFQPNIAFPFHTEGVPPSYPAAALLPRDVAAVRATSARTPMAIGDLAKIKLYYSCWERLPPTQPNFRFSGPTSAS